MDQLSLLCKHLPRLEPGITMRSSWGNVKIVHDKCGRYIVGCRRKSYTRNHPPIKYGFKTPILPKENSCIIKLRKLGYPMQQIAKALNRSQSHIHKVLELERSRRLIHFFDMRKLPKKTKQLLTRARWNTLLSFMPLWNEWILSEGGKPP